MIQLFFGCISPILFHRHMPLAIFFLPRVYAGTTGSPPLHDRWYGHTHFPILFRLPGPGFPTQQILPADCLMNCHPRHTAQTGNLYPLDWRRMGVPRFGTKPCKRGQVSISLTLYILFGYPPFSPTDPSNGILLKKPSATNAHTQ